MVSIALKSLEPVFLPQDNREQYSRASVFLSSPLQSIYLPQSPTNPLWCAGAGLGANSVGLFPELLVLVTWSWPGWEKSANATDQCFFTLEGPGLKFVSALTYLLPTHLLLPLPFPSFPSLFPTYLPSSLFLSMIVSNLPTIYSSLPPTHPSSTPQPSSIHLPSRHPQMFSEYLLNFF